MPNASKAPHIIHSREALDLYVGLDFGTSSTKAVHRQIGGVSDRRRAIDFGARSQEYPSYCYPNVGVIQHNRLLWGWDAVHAPECRELVGGIRRLKVVIAGSKDARFRDPELHQRFCEYLWGHGCDPQQYLPEHVGVLALASQLGLIYDLLLQEYDVSCLDVRFNVGVPIDHMEHNELLATYRRMCHAAELLYVRSPQPVHVRECLDAALKAFAIADGQEHPDRRVFVIPEAVAQVACYLESLEAKDGLHGVVDIGAGTTDVAIFNRRAAPHGGTTCYWYAAANIPCGGGLIERDVGTYLSEQGVQPTTRELVMEELHDLADPTVQRIVTNSLGIIRKATYPTWVAAYNKYRRQTPWDSIPLFLAGGVSQCRLAKGVFRDSWAKSQIGAHKVRNLPTPRQFALAIGMDFARLSVAFGLSYAEPELTGFSLPSDTPDQTPAIRQGMGNTGASWGVSCPCGGSNEECPRCDGSGLVEGNGTENRAHHRSSQPPAAALAVTGPIDVFIDFQMREPEGGTANARPRQEAAEVRCFCSEWVRTDFLQVHLQQKHRLSDHEARAQAEQLARQGPSQRGKPAGRNLQGTDQSHSSSRSRPTRSVLTRERRRRRLEKPPLRQLPRPQNCHVCGRLTELGQPLFRGQAPIPVCRRCYEAD